MTGRDANGGDLAVTTTHNDGDGDVGGCKWRNLISVSEGCGGSHVSSVGAGSTWTRDIIYRCAGPATPPNPGSSFVIRARSTLQRSSTWRWCSRMASRGFLLPGDPVPTTILPIPANPSASLKLGPGLRHIPPDTIRPVVAGAICVDDRKHAIWMESNGGRVGSTPQPRRPAAVHGPPDSRRASTCPRSGTR